MSSSISLGDFESAKMSSRNSLGGFESTGSRTEKGLFFEAMDLDAWDLLGAVVSFEIMMIGEAGRFSINPNTLVSVMGHSERDL